MKRIVQALLLALTGLGLLHTALFTDLWLRYVKEGLRPVLIASGVLLLVLGLAAAAVREEAGGQGHDHGHDHSTAPRIAWLLFLPALSLLLFPPPALGAYTASRANDRPPQQGRRFDPLPDTSSPVPMTLTDFTARVRQDRRQDMRGRSVRMTGFVTPTGQDGGWYLTRIIFTCCAADSQSVKVRMYGTPAPPADTWVAVTGSWHPRAALAALDVHGIRRVPQPVNAYTDDLPLTPS